jgi:hypothetical protein
MEIKAKFSNYRSFSAVFMKEVLGKNMTTTRAKQLGLKDLAKTL